MITAFKEPDFKSTPQGKKLIDSAKRPGGQKRNFAAIGGGSSHTA
jgi:hypothetical protein